MLHNLNIIFVTVMDFILIKDNIYYFIQKNNLNNVPEETDGDLLYFSRICHSLSGSSE